MAAAIEMHGVEALPADVADVRDMVERLAGSELRERIAARAARAHRAAVRVHARRRNRSLLINGVVDVHADEGARTLVVDWKSDALGELDPEELTARVVLDPAARVRARRAEGRR